MHHELLSVTYGILIILFFSVDDMSAPFEGQPFAWRVYMTMIGAMMMYEMIRSHYEWDDTFMYMCMQWSTYLMCGGTRYPYWMVAYGAYIGVLKVIRDAESRIAEMDEQVMSNGFHIINVHNLTAEPMRMAIPDDEQMEENTGSSAIGRQGGTQIISCGPGACNDFGLVAHEFGHAMGFFHEQMRSDRDKYLKIHWQNIREEYKHNFMKVFLISS